MSVYKSTVEYLELVYTGWAKSRYTGIIFFTGIVNDGREIKYRTKKVDFEGVLQNCITTFGPPCIMCPL
jgi:hypothetical protein